MEIFCECEELVKLWEVTDDKDVKSDILKIILDNYDSEITKLINPIVLKIYNIEKYFINVLYINFTKTEIFIEKTYLSHLLECGAIFYEKFDMYSFGSQSFSYVMDKTLYNKFIHLLNLSD